MPLIIGVFKIDNQTGGKFNVGNLFFTADKNNMHLEGRGSSYNQGDFNNQASLENSPSINIYGFNTDIVDSDLVEGV